MNRDHFAAASFLSSNDRVERMAFFSIPFFSSYNESANFAYVYVEMAHLLLNQMCFFASHGTPSPVRSLQRWMDVHDTASFEARLHDER